VKLLKVGLVVAWLGMMACQGSSSSQGPSVLAHLPVAGTLRTYHTPSPVGLVSSIVQADGGSLLLCDSSNVYRVLRTASGYSVVRLTRPSGVAWNPGGLAFRDGVVYVANGRTGRDVLALRMAGDALTLLRRITNPAMQDPESVVAQRDGTLVVADPTANLVLMYQPDGALRWRTKVPGAHGLTATGGNLYVSSLTDHSITEVDQSGKSIRRSGSEGTSSGRYLRPFGLAADGGRIVVTDTHNGTISILQGDLRVVRRVGANGQGIDLFNFPQATLPISEGYLVVDSFKNRLVRTDRSWTIQEQIVFGTTVPAGRQRPIVIGTDAHSTTYAMLPGVDLASLLGLRRPTKFVGSLNGLDHVGGNGSLTHVDFGDKQYGPPGQTWAQAVGAYVVVGSSQRSVVEVIDATTGMFTFLDVGRDSWWHSGTLLTSINLRRDLLEVIAPAMARFANARQLEAQGVSRRDVLSQAFSEGRPRSWLQDFTSTAGQQFLRSQMTPADARTYFDVTLKQSQQRAVELLMVKFLSGL